MVRKLNTAGRKREPRELRLREPEAQLQCATAEATARVASLQAQIAELCQERKRADAELVDLRQRSQLLAQTVEQLTCEKDQLATTKLDLERRIAELAPLASRDDIELYQAHVLGRISILTADIRGLRRSVRRRGTNGSSNLDGLRGSYLDLLENALTGRLYGDTPISPWSQGRYDPNTRVLGRDWPGEAQTMIGLARMRNIRMLAESVIEDNIEGDFLEAGVWRGGACIYMRGILAAYDIRDRKVWAADSFAGLPPPDAETYPEDTGDPHHMFKDLVVSLKEVRANFAKYDLLDEQVVFMPGWFKDTLPNAAVKSIALLRLDGDMYQSTIETLTATYHKVPAGGYVIIDDYILAGAREAVHDFRERQGISDPIQPIDGAGVFWRKAEKAPL